MNNQSLALVQKEEIAVGLIPWQEVMQIGELYAASGFFTDTQTAAQAFVKIMAGQEMGISALDAMSGLHIIKGKVTVGANILARKIKSSGKYDFTVNRLDDEACVIEYFQGAKSIGVSEFTIVDAKKLPQYASNPNYKNNTRNMLYARCMSNGFKWFTPDAIAGTVYTPEELDDAPEPRNVTPPKPATPANIEPNCDKQTAVEISLLWKDYGPKFDGTPVGQVAWLKKEYGVEKWSQLALSTAQGVLADLQKAKENDSVQAEAMDAVEPGVEAPTLTPHEAFAQELANWKNAGGPDRVVLRHFAKVAPDVALYVDATDEQASQMAQWLRSNINQLAVS